MFRRSLLLAGALSLACGSARAEERTLRVVSPWEVSSLEPSDTGYIAKRMGIADTLTQVEPDGRITGGVSDSWAVSDDKLTWRFRIAPGRKFHDGTPVTAGAVKDSFERGLPGAESLKTVPIASVTADGDSLIIVTRTPFSPLPSFLTDWGSIILAPRILWPGRQGGRLDRHRTLPRHPPGRGPRAGARGVANRGDEASHRPRALRRRAAG